MIAMTRSIQAVLVLGYRSVLNRVAPVRLHESHRAFIVIGALVVGFRNR